MSKFYNLEGQSAVVESTLKDMQPVKETWGVILGKIAAGYLGTKIGVVGGALAGTVAGAAIMGLGAMATSFVTATIGGLVIALSPFAGAIYGCLKGCDLVNLYVGSELKKALHQKAVTKYITEECDEIYNDIKKEYPKISLDVLNILKKKNQMYELRDDRGTIDKILSTVSKCSVTINKYTIIATGSSSSLESLYVLMYDEEGDKLIKRAIPVPNLSDLK